MKPRDGEFWIVEAAGGTTVGKCYGDDEWQIIGSDDQNAVDRAVRKIDIGALLDQPPARSSADSASLRDALDNSQSLLVMIDLVGPDSASWIKEDMRDLLTKQIVENRTSLSDPKRAEPQTASGERLYTLKEAKTALEQAIQALSLPHAQSQAESAPTAAEPDRPRNDPKVLARLLRAIAGSENAKASQHDVIFNAAAAELERAITLEGQHHQMMDQLGGVQRMLWLVIKAAGAPGGVWIDKEDVESFDHTRAQLYAETNLDTGAVHVEARTKENDQ